MTVTCTNVNNTNVRVESYTVHTNANKLTLYSFFKMFDRLQVVSCFSQG